MGDDGFKICPFCKEKIRKEAVKCRFCGEWLEQSEQAHANSSTNETVPTPLPIQNESPAPDKNKNEIVAPPKIKNGTSSKTLFWISIALLLPCCLVWFAGFAGLAFVHWSQLGPADGAAVGKMIGGLLMVSFVIWLTIRDMKGKTEKLFACSVILAAVTAIGTYYFLDARQKTKEKAAESSRQFVSDLNSLQEFVKNGAVGDIPKFKPTGDADTDACLPTFNDFWQNYIQAYRKANVEFQALDEKDVFDDSVFVVSNKSILETEIQKRVTAQKIIQELSTNTLSLFENSKKEIATLKVSNEYKNGLLTGINGMSSQYDKYFAAQIKIINAEQDYLRFMYDIFDGYQLKDNADTERESSNLVQRIQDSRTEFQEILKQKTATTEAAKAKLQQVGK
jgi:hypothetical protein